jgi:hypothetical protein
MTRVQVLGGCLPIELADRVCNDVEPDFFGCYDCSHIIYEELDITVPLVAANLLGLENSRDCTSTIREKH